MTAFWVFFLQSLSMHAFKMHQKDEGEWSDNSAGRDGSVEAA